MPVAKKDFKEDVKGVLQEWKSQDGKNATQLRVVVWIVDGKPTKAKLEKRSYFIQENGESKMGKAQGFTKQDLEYVMGHWSEIEMMFE